MDYNAEFTARETEIEQAERKKAVIVVNESSASTSTRHRRRPPMQPQAWPAAAAAAEGKGEDQPASAAPGERFRQIAKAASSNAQFLIDGDNLLLPLDVPQIQVIQRPPQSRSTP